MAATKFQITKATKAKSLLRLAIFGPSGAGKTFTSLRIATGIAAGVGKRVCVMDTERGTASKYADRFDFDVIEMPEIDINTYVEAINHVAANGYGVLIIDSMSHAWQDLLQEIDRLAHSKFRGNTWSAWSEGTPKQRSLVDAILSFPGHIIATMRSKTEWVQEDDGKGRKKPVRVGLTPEQGKGIEYEFDILMELSTDHIASIIKDRTGKFQDKIFTKPDEAFGTALIEWLNDGSAPAQPSSSPNQSTGTITEEQAIELSDILNQLPVERHQKFLDWLGVMTIYDTPTPRFDDARKALVAALNKMKSEGGK